MLRFVSFLTIGSLMLVAGLACGPAAPKAPDEIMVKGTVTMDGQPMKSGEVAFSQPGMPGRYSTVTDGAFSGKAYPGTNKVEIFHYVEGAPSTTDPTKKEKKN